MKLLISFAAMLAALPMASAQGDANATFSGVYQFYGERACPNWLVNEYTGTYDFEGSQVVMIVNYFDQDNNKVETMTIPMTWSYVDGVLTLDGSAWKTTANSNRKGIVTSATIMGAGRVGTDGPICPTQEVLMR